MNSWLSLANTLTALRLLSAPFVALAIVGEVWLFAFVLFFLAVASDVLDGRIARRLGQATAFGGLFDHATDALFVTLTVAAVVSHGHAPWLLVGLIPAAFIQYTLDSQALMGQQLRTSMLGRINGVAYFVVPGVMVVVETLEFRWFDYHLLMLLGWLLIATTLVSMSERAIAWANTRT
ncbi:MAG: CDP-alcohol phosphatidyltransferase family protein [Proteobacteria bacterium]|nr:CDP-alcohol phosphatidyltransferase family protein [Pseudomonadota bacterium]